MCRDHKMLAHQNEGYMPFATVIESDLIGVQGVFNDYSDVGAKLLDRPFCE